MQPYWNFKKNHAKYIEDTQKYYKYCPNCLQNTQSSKLYCSSCSQRLLIDGLEKHRIRLGSVGKDTVNYQQYMHRIFFGCNAPSEYRGLINNRIKVKIDKQVINNSVSMLHKLLYAKRFTYIGKEYIANQYYNNKYRMICTDKNITDRLLYNLVLYYISYYINQAKHFKSDAHFFGSMLYNLYTNIDTIALRLYGEPILKSRDEKYKITAKQQYHYAESIDKIVKPVMESIVKSM